MSFFVYILRTSSNTLYIGQTNNLEKRLKIHTSKNNKSEKYETRLESMKREYQLKKWTKAKKEALIARNLKLLKEL